VCQSSCDAVISPPIVPYTDTAWPASNPKMEELCHLSAVLIKTDVECSRYQKEEKERKKKECLELFEP